VELVPREDPFTPHSDLLLWHTNAFAKGVRWTDATVIAWPLFSNNLVSAKVAHTNLPGENFVALFAEGGGAIFEVLQIVSAGDGVHYTILDATMAAYKTPAL
jgi:hypothetical protein